MSPTNARYIRSATCRRRLGIKLRRALILNNRPLSTTELIAFAYPHGAGMSRCAMAHNVRRSMLHWGYRQVGRADTIGHPILWTS
jgi:hypothetical protein